MSAYSKKEIVKTAIQVLKNGGIIGFPTDTVYGIGCDAYNFEAVKCLYKLKHRSPDKPLILFIPNKLDVKKYAARIPLTGQKLIDSFWPGALTIIFPAECRGTPWRAPTIGVRIPSYEPILEILRTYERPLATTSANLEGTPPPLSHLEMNIKPDFIIPGKCKTGVSSTIIDITSFPPTLVREGKIGAPELEAVIKRRILHK